MPEQLDAQAALTLAGEDVTTLGAAGDVEAVTAGHVTQAEQAAEAAEAKAAESEAQAVTGSLSPMTAAADRDKRARYSRLRAAADRTAGGTPPAGGEAAGARSGRAGRSSPRGRASGDPRRHRGRLGPRSANCKRASVSASASGMRGYRRLPTAPRALTPSHCCPAVTPAPVPRTYGPASSTPGRWWSRRAGRSAEWTWGTTMGPWRPSAPRYGRSGHTTHPSACTWPRTVSCSR